MRFRIADFFKRLFRRQKQQPFKAPEREPEPKKKSSSFIGHRSKAPGTWLETVMRQHREKSKKVKKRRMRNKMGRKSRQINNRKAA